MNSQLRELLEETSRSQVPDGVAARAVAEARRRRRRRLLVSAGGLAAAFLVIVVIGVVQSVRTDEPATAQEAMAAAIPLRLPGPQGLAPLTEAPMAAASAAYIVDGEVVLVNAVTGEAVRAFASAGDIPPSLAGGSQGGLASPREADPRWTTVALSPDGSQVLLTVPSTPSADGLLYRFVFLLDVSAGEADRLVGVTVPISRDGQGTPTRGVAWSPDGASFACVCGDWSDSRLRIFEVSDSGAVQSVFAQPLASLDPTAVTWGSAGLAVHVRQRENWLLTLDGGFVEVPRSRGNELALGLDSDRYLIADSTHLHPVEGVPQVPGADLPIVQRAEYRVRTFDSESVETRQFAGSVGGTTALVGGFTVTIDINGSLHVLSIDETGDGFPLTRLPSRTSTISFAADLVHP